MNINSKVNIYLTPILIVFVNLFANTLADNKVSAYIKPKKFDGFVQNVENSKVNVFLGIPYAKPPIGKLRFKKPVAYEYSKPINATNWPNACPQSKAAMALNQLIGNTNYSEDCLYLNIWAPVLKNCNNCLKPVLFWIHGGELTFGASNLYRTIGDILAARGDIVVVTINYRLNILGFLYSGSDDAPGNVGLWDQAMALKWVNEHIHYFGGDPNQITIIGQSAGSLSVSLHLLSPITRNLFKNAVMMSGATHEEYYQHKDKAKKMWSEEVNRYCCKKDLNRGSANCLRRVNVNNLTDSELTLDLFNKPFVIYGDEFLPEKPSDAFKNGCYKKNANLLMGTTNDEGSLFLNLFFRPKVLSILNSKNLKKSEAKDILKFIFTKYFDKILNISSDEVYNLYLSQIPANNSNLIRRKIGDALGDYMITCPTVEFGKQLFGGNRNSTKVYQYLWSAKYDKTWHGANHGSEIEYSFGVPFRNIITLDLQSDPNLENKKEMSDKLIQTLSHFARYGKPPPQEGVAWNSYYSIDDKIITPYYEFSNNIKTKGNFDFGLKYECNKLWKKYLND